LLILQIQCTSKSFVINNKSLIVAIKSHTANYCLFKIRFRLLSKKQYITDLFKWAKKTDVHPLIKSSIVHFEIEFIHPFIDGNGRIGRLWQTLILSQRNELFAWLPVETVVYENQKDYYNALLISQQSGDSVSFIEFMLSAVFQALEELPVRTIADIFTDINTDKLSKAELEFLEQIARYLEKNGEITNYRAQLLTKKSDSSVKKYLAKFAVLGLLEVEGKNKGRKYKIKKKQLP
jgi:Fic family protein